MASINYECAIIRMQCMVSFHPVCSNNMHLSVHVHCLFMCAVCSCALSVHVRCLFVQFTVITCTCLSACTVCLLVCPVCPSR